MANDFTNEKCYGLENSKNNHYAYQNEDIDVGLIDYSLEDYQVEYYISAVEKTKNHIDYSSYLEGKKISALYALECLRSSCK